MSFIVADDSRETRRDIEVDQFLEIMTKVGFELIMYKADVDHREETELDSNACLKDNPDAIDVYSGCWFGGEFFEWLFPPTGREIKVIQPNMTFHGVSEGTPEVHYFFIITTSDMAHLLNTYGGVDYLIIQHIPLDEINSLLDRYRDNDVSVIPELFGVIPNYASMNITLTLTEGERHMPTSQSIKAAVNQLISHSPHREDKKRLHRIMSIISENYVVFAHRK